MVASIFINERGAIGPPCGPVSLPPPGEIEFRVRNGGCIEIRFFNRGLEIRLNRASVSPLALTELLYQVHDRVAGSSVVSFADDGWQGRLYNDRDTLCAHISDWLFRAVRNERWRHIDFQRHMIDASTSAIATKRHLGVWQERLRVHNDPRELSAQLDFAFSGRFTLYRMPTGSDRPVIEAVGSAIGSYSREWVQQAPGRSLRDAPDPRYGQWVEGHIAGSARGGIVFDRIDALVTWTRAKSARLRYDRAIVPIIRSDDTVLLLGVTQAASG